jgi:hypothetical protein
LFLSLAVYFEEGDKFLRPIVTGDEIWVDHSQPERKRKSTQWKYLSSVEEIQDATIGRQVDVDHLVGFSRACS